MIKHERDRVVFESSVLFQVLPDRSIGVFTIGSVTPTVKGNEIWLFKNINPITVTYFTDGALGQRIHIGGEGLTTLKYDVNKIITNTGADKLLQPNLIYSFTLINKLWVEDVDTVGGGGGGGGGESNTLSNGGLTGLSLALAKVGVDLRLKSLTPGTGVTLTDDVANKSIIINAPSDTTDRVNVDFGTNTPQFGRVISAPIQIEHLDGSVYNTSIVDIEVVVTDAANDREPSATATLGIGSLGTLLAGNGTATGIYRSNASGRIDVAVTEPSAAHRYLWIIAGGNTRLFVKAKNDVQELIFT